MDGCIRRPAQKVEEGELPVSLLTQAMEECVFLTKTHTDDDFGGHKPTYTDGTHFLAAIGKDRSPVQKVAEKEGLSEAFTVVVEQSMALDFHDVFRRVSDGSIFRVTSRTTDSTAHKASTVKIAVVTAERWVLPA